MKAVILAGGKGTRLAPYTTVFPKPLIPIGHRPILDLIITQLATHGFSDITLSVGYLAELVQAYFSNGNSPSGVSLSYVKETEPTGTAGALKLLNDMDDSFLVMNGDVLTDLDYTDFFKFHKKNGGLLTIGTYTKKTKIDLGVISTTKNTVTNYIEKPTHTYDVSMGVYAYEPEVLKFIPQNQYFDFPDLVLKLIKSGEKVVSYPFNGYWLDIGRPEDYKLAQEKFTSDPDQFNR